jgi:hypothetical protein
MSEFGVYGIPGSPFMRAVLMGLEGRRPLIGSRSWVQAKPRAQRTSIYIRSAVYPRSSTATLGFMRHKRSCVISTTSCPIPR